MLVCIFLFITLVLFLVTITLLYLRNNTNIEKIEDLSRPHVKKPESYDTNLENIEIDDLSRPYIKNGQVNMESKKSMSNEIQEENLKLLKEMLEAYNIKYYIDCGTLLGAIRDKGFCKGDTDVDIMTSKNGINEIRLLLPKLEKLGFISFRNSSTWMAMSLLRKGEYIDIYTHWPQIPFELVCYPFLGTQFPIPKYYDEYLTELYGNWKVPDPNGKGNGEWEKGMPKYLKNHKIIP